MVQTKTIRPPAVAGVFYPEDTDQLQDQVNHYLYEEESVGLQVPKAIIVPHAGYIYSGSIAASAYRNILQYRHVIRKVILLGPAHHVSVKGLAVPTVDQFQTPLGEIKLDTKTIATLVNDFPQMTFSDDAHADEHSLETQLPFLQSTLASFRLIPILVGESNEIEVAEVLGELWGGEECLVVISSDLSHFLTAKNARELDLNTAQSIEALRGDQIPDRGACGKIPVSGLLCQARQRNLKIKRYDLGNSSETSGDKNRVVGYGSWGLFQS